MCPQQIRHIKDSRQEIIDNQIKLIEQFKTKINSIDELHLAVLDGIKYRRALYAGLLSKFGSETGRKTLTQSDMREMNEILAIRAKRMKKTFKLEFSRREFLFVRRVLLRQFQVQKNVLKIAREQYVISLETALEAFITDTLGNIFENIPESMKSTRKTLGDEEVIDSIKNGNNPLSLLRERKIKDIMYGSEITWMKFLQYNLKFKIKISDTLTELGLVRNCLIHNNGRVSDDLRRTIKKSRYQDNKIIFVTPRDIKKYKNSIIDLCNNITQEVCANYRTSQK